MSEIKKAATSVHTNIHTLVAIKVIVVVRITPTLVSIITSTTTRRTGELRMLQGLSLIEVSRISTMCIIRCTPDGTPISSRRVCWALVRPVLAYRCSGLSSDIT